MPPATVTTTPPEPRWYALAVLARKEKAAADDLGRRGIEAFLPLYVERRIWSDRIHRVERALLPGYLFVRAALCPAVRVELLKARGAMDLVGRLPGDVRIARSVPDWQVESLQAVAASERTLDPVSRFAPGALVEVGTGPLKGARGVVEQGADGKRRLVVQVELLGRGVRCVLCADDVVAAPPEERPRASA